jgi:hypothetical protein
MSLAGDFQEAEAIKRAQGDIKKLRHEAEQYANALKKEALADKIASEEVLDSARKEYRQIIDAGKDEIAEGALRIENQQRQIRIDRRKTEEWAAILVAKETELKGKEQAVKSLEGQAHVEIARAQKLQAEAEKRRADCDDRMNRTLLIWQRST